MTGTLHTAHHRHAPVLATGTLALRLTVSVNSGTQSEESLRIAPTPEVTDALKRQPRARRLSPRSLQTSHGNLLSP